ncbi:MAG: hypothetical protein M1828_004900 [Chrysothrix sp. TS-e1954]|nr:MAG: hypothetical protein M1828_004900 [Chrysothrix sp. TS-e1954]
MESAPPESSPEPLPEPPIPEPPVVDPGSCSTPPCDEAPAPDVPPPISTPAPCGSDPASPPCPATPNPGADSVEVNCPTCSASLVSRKAKKMPDCGLRKDPSNFFHLRSHVIEGSREFDNLYLRQYPDDKSKDVSQPIMSDTRSEGLWVYWDAGRQSVAIWQEKCQWAGLSMLREVKSSQDSFGRVSIVQGFGSDRMSNTNGELVWLNEAFGNWLVCRANDGTGTFDLKYWDAVSNKNADMRGCAKVQLLVEPVKPFKQVESIDPEHPENPLYQID